MSKHTKIIDGSVQIKAALDWAYSLILKGLEGGSVAIDIYRHEEVRNLNQNAKMWPMLSDISEQVVWHGEKYSPDDWKDILSSDWSKQTIVPGISGGFVALGVRTSKMNKREFSELIELMYAFGATKDVRWSEKSLACYESYREAQV